MRTALRTLTALFLALLLTGSLVACGEGDPDTAPDTTTADTTTVEDTTGGDTNTVEDTTVADTTTVEDTTPVEDTTTVEDTTDATTPTCTHNGFTAVAEDAGPFLGAFMYLAQDSLGAPVSTLSIELADGNGGATAAGTYQFEGDNYATCGNCGTISLNCDGDLANCERGFLAQSGTLEITNFGATGEAFSGTVTNAVFAEITLDAEFNSTVVDGGETWCIESYSFNATVQ